MTSILGSDADVSEKVRLYNQVLLRYNEMTKTRAAKPTPVVVMKADTVDNEAAALSRLSTVTWNERGELMHEGVAVHGSNVVDLVHDLLRNRKTTDPVGWRQFANQMRAANVPMELVGNVARRRYMQKRTPIKRSRNLKFVIPAGWESY